MLLQSDHDQVPTHGGARRTSTWPHAGALALMLLAGLPFAAHAQAGIDTEEIKRQIASLRAEQARIAELQQRTEASIRALESSLDIASPPPASVAAAALAPASAASSIPSRLKISGDLRLRAQGDYSDNDAHNRNSGQIRGRLGATFAANDFVTIGARLVTGSAEDPNSVDVQLSNFDDDFEVSLDQAYVQLNFDNLKLLGGKMPQPFTRTELVWDGDVNPQGLAATWKRSFANGSAFRANGLYFVIDENAAGGDSTMLGAQAGFDSAAIGAWKFDASLAWYNYQLDSIAGGDSGDFRSNLRNPDGSYRSKFHLGDLIAGATWSGIGDNWPLRIVADYVHNFGAATSADTGYGVDFLLGRTSKVGDWRFGYGYAVAETDAVFAAFSQDNTAIATNYRQHMLSADYVVSPNTLLSATWAHYKPYAAADAGSNDPDDWLDRFRVAFMVSY